MKIREINEDLILEGVKDFNLKHIFECGQCFRWDLIDENQYVGVAKGHLLSISQHGDTVLFSKTTRKTFDEIWRVYFDMERNYGELKKTIAQFHPILEDAVQFGDGIRILKQDPWETLISFIVSANNNIPRIKQIIEKLSSGYGEPLGEANGKTNYSFPSPNQLSGASVDDFKKMGLGYRAKYIYNVVQGIVNVKMDFDELSKLETADLEVELIKLSGVGPKVASCVMLFGFGKEDVFPVDTWIRKVMSEWFLLNAEDKNKIREYVKNNFGGIEGLVQQYLFYYARENKLGS